MKNEREYWLAGGEDEIKARAFIDRRGAAIKEMLAVGKRFGGTPIHEHNRIGGLMFEGDTPPAGWVKKGSFESRPYFLPRKSSKANREAYEAIRAPRVPSVPDFCRDVLDMAGVMAGKAPGSWGFRILYGAWEFVGETLIFSIPLSDGESVFKPNGSRRLAMSEYWAMKESAAAEEKAPA